MNKKIIEFVNDIDMVSYDEFVLNSNIDTSYLLDMHLSDYNTSWLDRLEEYLPFISNIVNVDYVSSDVVLKSYENKFIKTLLYKLYNFILSEKKIIIECINSNSKSITSNIKTFIEEEEIDVEIKIKSTKKENSNNGNSNGLSLIERIDRVLNIITNLIDSNFIKSLDDVSIIMEEISRTEVFEQEINYRKSFELNQIIDKYINDSSKRNDEETKKIINDKLYITSFMEYQLLKNSLKDKKDGNIYKEFLEHIIEEMVLETSIDEKSFKRMIIKKFEDEYTKKKNREKNIQNTFIKSIDSYNKQVKDALRSLKG